MIHKLWRSTFFLLPALLLFCGCQTDYSEKAVDKAREYALKNLRGLNEDQRHFIRFTNPVIYSNVLFERKIVMPSGVAHVKRTDSQYYPVAPHQDFMHHCIVWAPPGLDGKVVVIGEGERSFRFWDPIRVVVKNFVPTNMYQELAIQNAVIYATNNMLYLNDLELNRVKYSRPEILYTNFPLTFKVRKDRNLQNPSPWEEYIAEQMENTRPKDMILTQISLVWDAEKPDDKIVISGFSGKGTLYEWQIHTAQCTSATDLKAHTLSPEETKKIVKDPGPKDGQLVFPAEQIGNRGNNSKESGSIFGGNMKF